MMKTKEMVLRYGQFALGEKDIYVYQTQCVFLGCKTPLEKVQKTIPRTGV